MNIHAFNVMKTADKSWQYATFWRDKQTDRDGCRYM